MRIEDHIVFRAQVSFAQFLVREIGVGNAIVIQRRARPAFILGPLPGVDVADSGDVEFVRLHIRK